MTDDELSALVPNSTLPEQSKIFLAGLRFGFIFRRGSFIERESAILAQIGAHEISSDSAFHSGSTVAQEFLLEADRNAAYLSRLIGGTSLGRLLRIVPFRSTRVLGLLASLSELQRKELEEAFPERYHVRLRDVVRRSFTRASASDICAALDHPTANYEPEIHQGAKTEITFSADELHSSIQRKGTIWPGLFFLGRSKEERTELEREFDSKYGSLTDKFRRRYRGWEREILLDLRDHGSVSWGKLLYLCVVGIGTDEQGLLDLLEDMPSSELANAREDFNRLWRERAPWYERPFPHLLGNLERRIWIETGGDSFFDLQEYLNVTPERDEDLHGRLERLYRHERSGVLLKKLDLISREGQLMDRSVQLVRDFRTRFDTSSVPGFAAEARLNSLIRYAEQDCAIFRELKHTIGNTVTGLVATTSAACAAFALSINRFEVEHIMIIVGTISITTRVILKNLLKGRGYHSSELGADLFFGVLDGGTLFTTYIFRQALIRYSTKFLTKLSMRTGVTRLSGLIDGRRTQRFGVRPSELACRN